MLQKLIFKVYHIKPTNFAQVPETNKLAHSRVVPIEHKAMLVNLT